MSPAKPGKPVIKGDDLGIAMIDYAAVDGCW
jgi:hypothetical protein